MEKKLFYIIEQYKPKAVGNLPPFCHTYDGASRIEKVQMPGKTVEYAYDASGNRAKQTETHTSAQVYGAGVVYNKKITEYAYSSANELEKSVETMYNENTEQLKRETLYEYDDNGSLYSSAAATIGAEASTSAVWLTDESPDIELTRNSYDSFSRLTQTSVSKNGETTTIQYIYNGDGLRMSKNVVGDAVKTTNYLYSEQYVVAESGDDTVQYVRGLSYIAKIGATDGISYYQYNAHGDVAQMVDVGGNGSAADVANALKRHNTNGDRDDLLKIMENLPYYVPGTDLTIDGYYQMSQYRQRTALKKVNSYLDGKMRLDSLIEDVQKRGGSLARIAPSATRKSDVSERDEAVLRGMGEYETHTIKE